MSFQNIDNYIAKAGFARRKRVLGLAVSAHDFFAKQVLGRDRAGDTQQPLA